LAHCHPIPPVVVMPGYEDRDCYEDKRGNQAAAPPTILFQYLFLETVEAPFKALFWSLRLTSSATRFFRH
jgi:hypothetical protein